MSNKNFNESFDFSQRVHNNLAVSIYRYLNAEVICMDSNPSLMSLVDSQIGVDRLLVSNFGGVLGTRKDGSFGAPHLVTVQERFRTSKSKEFGDVTLRYQKKHSDVFVNNSEFFKIEANYLLYGVTDAINFNSQLGGFLKWVVVDLNLLKTLVEKGLKIVPKMSHEFSSKFGYSKKCNSKYYANTNTLYVRLSVTDDGVSSFISMDVDVLNSIDSRLIVSQSNYFI